MKRAKHEYSFGDDNTLLIIGNGFDINLGLKTSYFDFIMSDQFRSINSFSKKGKNLSEKDINNFFAFYLELKYTIQNWVDIEKEISNYVIDGYNFTNIRRVSSINLREDDGSITQKYIQFDRPFTSNIPNFKEEYCQVKEALKSFLKAQPFKNSGIEYSHNTEAYLLMSKIEDIDNIYVIDFNYTDTVDSFLKNPSHIIHIHGSIKEDDDIVFGIADEIKITKRQKLEQYNYIYKSSSPYLNSYGINKLFAECNHLVFFGYSLGETDRSYFEDFFQELSVQGRMSEKEIDIFYYDDGELDQINSRIRNFANSKVSEIRKNHNLSYIPVHDMNTYELSRES